MSKEKIKIKDLIPDDSNFNKGNPFGESLIEKSFDKFGAGRSILLDKNNRIIAGNKSTQKFVEQGGEDVLIVETDGKTLVAVKRNDIDLNTKRGREMALADNASAKANIEWNFDNLHEWDMPLEDWGIVDFETVEPLEEDESAVAETISKAKELQEKWQVKTGDLWRLGEHRLLCGDSTKREDVERLMGGEKVELLLTDPPYGIALNSEWQNKVHEKEGKAKNHDVSPIANDLGQITADMFQSYSRRIVFGFPYLNDDEATGWFVWNKEPNFEGKSLTSPVEMAYSTTWQGFRKLDLLWSGYLREANSEDKVGHPTQKPVKLIAHLLGEHKDKIIADWFCGSGTTLIACEQLNRKCYAIEIAPEYVAVTLERWHILTNKTPELIDE